LIVGDHHSVNLRFGIWFRPLRCAFVSFLYFMLSSKPEAFSQKRPSHVGKYVPVLIDTVAKLPLLVHETRRLSDGHVDGVAVAWRRADAVDANLKFGNGR